MLDVWQPSAWAAWNGELDKWFVWRAIKSASVPLAIAIVGTLLGVIGAIALTMLIDRASRLLKVSQVQR